MVRLRPATGADAAAVADVYLGSRHRHLAFVPLAHDDDDVRGWVAEHLIPTQHVVVAVHDDGHDEGDGGRIVGFSATTAQADRAWLEQLYVDPDRVGGGIGAALLDEALARLRRPVQLWTFAQNAGARRFYERHGFIAVEFGDGTGNEEGAPDVRYELA